MKTNFHDKNYKVCQTCFAGSRIEIYTCSKVHLAHVEYEIGIPIKRGFHFYWF